MSHLTVYEFDKLVAESADQDIDAHTVPVNVFNWLEQQCLALTEQDSAAWIRPSQHKKQKAVQLTNYVGVILTPQGFQIEVLPKTGLALDGNATQIQQKVRQQLIDMLRCLRQFRHIQTDSARLAATQMPLLEVFIREFLLSVAHVVRQGLRSAYITHCDNLFVLKGKLLITEQLRHHHYRPDRFFTEHDVFSTDRPENRLLHTALLQTLSLSTAYENQQLARELSFAFNDLPCSTHIKQDFQRVQLDRNMRHYADALAWARLLLNDHSPLTGSGGHLAPSLLFPMQSLFEAFVAKHLAKQLYPSLTLKTQAQSHYLVQHQQQNWFQLKPDLVIQQDGNNKIVLDTKWKLVNRAKSTSKHKYDLLQSDFYQLYAYGHTYLDGKNDLVLIYPKTDHFNTPLPKFSFTKNPALQLWVVPFCLDSRRLLIPAQSPLSSIFKPDQTDTAA